MGEYFGIGSAIIIILAVVSYFIGNINGAILVGKAYGIDVRSEGSGNAGTTNALRAIGKRAGAITFVIDVAKGWVCGFASYRIVLAIASAGGGTQAATDAVVTAFFAALLCGLCVVVGHMYPAVFRFKGGKGVATAFGVLLSIDWVFALVLFAIVIVFTVIFRRVSLSVMIAVALALVLVFTGLAKAQAEGLDAEAFWRIWIIFLLALVVWKHRANIRRLLSGEESKLTFGKH